MPKKDCGYVPVKWNSEAGRFEHINDYAYPADLSDLEKEIILEKEIVRANLSKLEKQKKSTAKTIKASKPIQDSDLNLFKRGDKFKLKSWVAWEDLLAIGFEGESDLDWVFDQEYFVCTISQSKSSKNDVYFYHELKESEYHFDISMVEKLNTPPRGHPLTKIFSDTWTLTQ